MFIHDWQRIELGSTAIQILIFHDKKPLLVYVNTPGGIKSNLDKSKEFLKYPILRKTNEIPDLDSLAIAENSSTSLR